MTTIGSAGVISALSVLQDGWRGKRLWEQVSPSHSEWTLPALPVRLCGPISNSKAKFAAKHVYGVLTRYQNAAEKSVAKFMHIIRLLILKYFQGQVAGLTVAGLKLLRNEFGI